jgi:hypothetical protein
MNNIIKELIDNKGYISEEMLPRLAKEFPKCRVIIKWEQHPRSSHYAIDAVNVIMDAERNKSHVREVFINATNLDWLVEILEPTNTK